jgi:glycosyltransferase involved in cell wall biosynthesis
MTGKPKTEISKPYSNDAMPSGTRPLVSVVTVCRNSANSIARTFESVLHQSYRRIEYLVIDGASTDGTLEVIRKYEPKFRGRMRWISEKDKGIYDAMNKGIGLATGRIIGLINSDDWYEPEAVRAVAEAYRNNGDAVYYGMLRVLEDGQEVMLKLSNYRFLHRDVVGHPAYFVAKRIYQQHGSYRLDYEIASDFEFMMRLIHRNVPFVQINQVLANFNYGGESSLRESKTIEEYMRIRCEYGYLPSRELRIRLFRLKISRLLDRIFHV